MSVSVSSFQRLLLEKLRIVGVVVQVFLLLLSASSRMFGTVLLCCWSFGLLPLTSSLVHGNLPLDEGPVAGRRTETSFLSEIGQ